MTSFSWLVSNLKLTLPTAFLFGVLGSVLSVPMSFLVDPEATLWRLPVPHQGGIETQRLMDVGRFQARVILGSAVVGVAVAQVTFVVHAVSVNREARSKDE